MTSTLAPARSPSTAAASWRHLGLVDPTLATRATSVRRARSAAVGANSMNAGHLGPDDLAPVHDRLPGRRWQRGQPVLPHQAGHELEDALRAAAGRGQAGGGGLQGGVEVGRQRSEDRLVDDGRPHDRRRGHGQGQHQGGPARHAHPRGLRHPPDAASSSRSSTCSATDADAGTSSPDGP